MMKKTGNMVLKPEFLKALEDSYNNKQTKKIIVMPRYFIDKVRDTHVEQDMYTPNWELVGQGLAAKEQEFNKVLDNLDILENININVLQQDNPWLSEEKSKNFSRS